MVYLYLDGVSEKASYNWAAPSCLCEFDGQYHRIYCSDPV